MPPSRFHASPAADLAWPKVVYVLRAYWRDGVEGLGRQNWQAELGVRVQGGESNPLARLEFALSAEHALAMLRRRCIYAYRLTAADIEGQPFWTSRGTGAADMLSLDHDEGSQLFEAAKELVYSLLEDRSLPADAGRLLDESQARFTAGPGAPTPQRRGGATTA